MALREERRRSVTLGVSTYFASRWLSPRLMAFTDAHRKVRLRIQPMVDLFDLEREGIDVAIRWGKGGWTDMRCEPLFLCPAFPVAAPPLADAVRRDGLESVMRDATLLDDRGGGVAWAEWLAAAALPQVVRKGALTIPDPNVRVQAVIDGQGVTINARLAARELDADALRRISDVELSNYGYHPAIPADAIRNAEVAALPDWLKSAAAEEAMGG